MSKFLFFSGIVFLWVLLPLQVHAGTIVESIGTDTTWSPDNGIYVIRGDAMVQNATLIILPGTRVEFEPGARMHVFRGSSVVANGTKENPIVFTEQTPSSENVNEGVYDSGIYFYGPLYEGINKGEFSYANFLHMDDGIMADASATVTVENCTFDMMRGYGVNNSGGIVSVTNTNFLNSSIAGYSINTTFAHSDNVFDTVIPGWRLDVNLTPGESMSIDSTDGVYELLSAEVARTATLSIGSGVFIHDAQHTDEGLFDVQGNLSIVGTADNPITIYGDGNCTTQYPIINFYRWSGHVPAPPDPSIMIDHVNFRDLCGGITGTHGLLHIDNSTFEHIASTAVHAYGTTSLTLNNSEFKNGDTGILLTGVAAIISNNSFHDNTGGIRITDVFNVDISSNWWGSINGPTIETNIGGDGQSIIATNAEGLIYTPWLTNDPFTEPESEPQPEIDPEPEPEPQPANTRDPVIIVPGIMGTKLSKDYGDALEVWPNIFLLAFDGMDELLNQLILLSSGIQDPNRPILLGDIIRSSPESDVFDGLISQLQEDGYVEGVDLFVLPYDWRLSNRTNALVLKDKITGVLDQTGKQKVDVIAHSMGGILTKAYVAQYGKEYIDQLFFIGTPHLGAPKGFKALMYGDNMGLVKFGINILSPNRVKVIAQNMPSIFELLPSRKYVDTLGFRYVEYKGYLDYLSTTDFLIEQGKNTIMLANADILHSSLDNLDLTGIKTYTFAGCGIGKTITGIQINKKTFFTEGYKVLYGTGDETVPLQSAVDNGATKQFYVKEYSHATLPSVVPVRTAIAELLKGEEPSSISTDKAICNSSGKAMEIHSPVSLHIYDEENNHTGPLSDGNIEYGIEGVSYDIIDHEKFAFLPEGHTYRIVNKAEDVGTYDLVISDVGDADEVTNEKHFVDVPITSVAMVSELIVGDDSHEYRLRIDTQGDGLYDATIEPYEAESAARRKERTVQPLVDEKIPVYIEEPQVILATNRVLPVGEKERNYEKKKNVHIEENTLLVKNASASEYGEILPQDKTPKGIGVTIIMTTVLILFYALRVLIFK